MRLIKRILFEVVLFVGIFGLYIFIIIILYKLLGKNNPLFLIFLLGILTMVLYIKIKSKYTADNMPKILNEYTKLIDNTLQCKSEIFYKNFSEEVKIYRRNIEEFVKFALIAELNYDTSIDISKCLKLEKSNSTIYIFNLILVTRVYTNGSDTYNSINKGIVIFIKPNKVYECDENLFITYKKLFENKTSNIDEKNYKNCLNLIIDNNDFTVYTSNNKKVNIENINTCVMKLKSIHKKYIINKKNNGETYIYLKGSKLLDIDAFMSKKSQKDRVLKEIDIYNNFINPDNLNL